MSRVKGGDRDASASSQRSGGNWRRGDNNNPFSATNTANKNPIFARPLRVDRNNNSNYPHKIGLKRVEELLGKTPEDIILEFSNPRFHFEDYLNPETMGEALMNKLTHVICKAFESHSIQVLMKNQIEKIVESKYFLVHLYNAIDKPLLVGQYKMDLIESTLKLCCRFLHIQPLCQPKLAPMKDRLELLITLRLNDQGLKQLFDELDKLANEAAIK